MLAGLSTYFRLGPWPAEWGPNDPGARAATCYHIAMNGMEMYAKFMFALTLGLVGVGMVLMTLLETLFSLWDPGVDARQWWRRLARAHSDVSSVRAEDILYELEGRGRYAPSRPARTIDRRREVLRDMREAEQRAASPEIAEAL